MRAIIRRDIPPSETPPTSLGIPRHDLEGIGFKFVLVGEDEDGYNMVCYHPKLGKLFKAMSIHFDYLNMTELYQRGVK